MLFVKMFKDVFAHLFIRIVETTKWILGYKYENLIDATDYEKIKNDINQ